MPHYYVNDEAQDNGDHEVHKKSCDWLPDAGNRTYLGLFDSCSEAVEEAREHHFQVNGCAICSPSCHTS